MDFLIQIKTIRMGSSIVSVAIDGVIVAVAIKVMLNIDYDDVFVIAEICT